MKTREITRCAILLCLALILSYIESLIPLSFGVPGVKVGLPNIAIVFVFYKMGFKRAITVSLLRVILVSVLFGNVMTLAYSLTGATFSIISMLIAYRTKLLSEIGVSVVGAVFHNLGQILVAVAVLQTTGLVYYFPVLCISGVAAGIIIGIISGIMVKRIKIND